ncbi:gamma-glutamyl-gamma-aminobutyrate hydrolase family protein [Helicobacter saguini]|uniref:Gamma-glutamyl-gamma-aminobutyrate hydrolase family protein n=1 Tax=Helicobacter saguini TaxID=1548018 RepID=A0A347VPM0_9HELI|nr:gamma-glutamyl-CDP-amidate hydrolase [Helicobacter saguini]MWV61300.1 gamma-glutamyl-gamma-aminobutyrate hydrolase family protein [Helicobacter saguini]MWV68031.1 gamma-glutamyl-gamma-aminobutyrate hydrolase family protein [Helicobacter saguini]MWV70502.1 gamma-glutamyl-gamma-aminobutyrate hydrolase family protein [Helicobacter saguini]MWV72406.1 gamma-glutamyl-gamma-aminobutyrate hydrolase family protein [Helicobacter saguini]TLD91856.1 gamma-glutamyl-gamma-aminobutyrate hydrolase family p
MKFIAITQRLIKAENYYELRETLGLQWGELFHKNELFKGFLPLPLSYEIPFSKYLESKQVKAVILSGGNDLSLFSDSDLSILRDKYESSVIESCMRHNIPLLGVCRGAQMIAHFFGSVIESNTFSKIDSINHIKSHNIIMKNEIFKANSFHNFCITKLGDDLETLAIANDNTIESFKHKTLPIYAIMWHIERENGLENTSILRKWLKNVANYKLT